MAGCECNIEYLSSIKDLKFLEYLKWQCSSLRRTTALCVSQLRVTAWNWFRWNAIITISADSLADPVHQRTEGRYQCAGYCKGNCHIIFSVWIIHPFLLLAAVWITEDITVL